MLRKDGDDQVLSQVRVPLSYSPKRKYLDRLEMTADGEKLHDQLAIKLPRMSFEIVALTADPQRQLPKTNTLRCGSHIDGDGTNRIKLYTPVPYVIQFQINIFSKTQDDALQVVEQILPFFNPQYTLSINAFADITGIVDDLPIILQSITFLDDYEGSVEQRRTIIYTLDFEMKVNFRASFAEGGDSIIRLVDGKLYNLANRGLLDSGLIETVRVTPDPIDTLGHPDSDFGFNTEIISIWDSA